VFNFAERDSGVCEIDPKKVRENLLASLGMTTQGGEMLARLCGAQTYPQ